MRVQESGPHEAAGRIVAAREPDHARAAAERAQGVARPRNRLGMRGLDVHIVTHILGMPGEGRLVGKHVQPVVVHVHAVGLAFDDDGLLPIAYQPVQLGHAIALAGRLGHDDNVLKRLAHLGHRGEARRHPQRELVGRHVHRSLFGSFGELGVAGEVKAGDGESRLVGAIEVARHAAHDDAHAHAGMLGAQRTKELRGDRRPPRGDDHALAVALAPIEVAAEIQVAGCIGKTNARAHNDLLTTKWERPNRSLPFMVGPDDRRSPMRAVSVVVSTAPCRRYFFFLRKLSESEISSKVLFSSAAT